MSPHVPCVVLLALCAVLPGQQVWLSSVNATQDQSPPPATRLLERRLAVAGDAVYAVWIIDDWNAPVWWSRSLDRGVSWTPAAPFLPPSGPTYTGGLQLVAHGSTVVAVWNAVVGRSFVHVATSHDRGQSWRLRPIPTSFGCQRLVAEGTNIVWVSDGHVYASTDGGSTWTGPWPLAGAGTNLGPLSDAPLLALEGGVLHAMWGEWTPGNPATWRSYANASHDLGRTWRSTDRPLLADPQANSFPVDLVAAPGVVMHLWLEGNGIRFDRSLDGGTTWLAAPTILPAPVTASPRLVFDGANALVAWGAPSGSRFHVSYLRSGDLGATWQAPAAPLLTWPWAAHTRLNEVFGGGGLFVLNGQYRSCWSLPCHLSETTLASADGGVTWSWPAGITSLPTTGAVSRVVDRGALFGLWTDNTYQIPPRILSFDRLGGPRSLGGAATGTGNRAPVLAMPNVPMLGFRSELQVLDGLAGAPAILAFGMTRSPVPFLAGQLPLQPMAFHFAMLDGTGAAALAFRLPPYGGLYEFACQAYVLDPGAAYGVAMSDGVEVRMY